MNRAFSSWEWAAAKYAQHSSVQQAAALGLLEQSALTGSETILDLGCGDGKITAELAHRVKQGCVLGIDKSPEMVKYAQQRFTHEQHPNLSFSQGNAEALKFHSEYDIVFSSFALQWCSNLNDTFQGIQNSLRANGRLIATIPLSISNRLDQSLYFMANSSTWKRYFSEKNCAIRLHNANTYAKHIDSSGFYFQKWSVVDQEVLFSGQVAFKAYVAQWLPHLMHIPIEERELFLQDLVDYYVSESSLSRPDEKVLFVFSRLDLICEARQPLRDMASQFATKIPSYIDQIDCVAKPQTS